jgi:hypothetical protein
MADGSTVKLVLAVPVKPYGEEVKEVTLRRPTTKELRQCGQPYMMVQGGGGTAMQANYDACAKLLTMVCDPPLPAGTVDTLDAADFDDMAMILMGFTKRARPGASESGSPPTS